MKSRDACHARAFAPCPAGRRMVATVKDHSLCDFRQASHSPRPLRGRTPGAPIVPHPRPLPAPQSRVAESSTLLWLPGPETSINTVPKDACGNHGAKRACEEALGAAPTPARKRRRAAPRMRQRLGGGLARSARFRRPARNCRRFRPRSRRSTSKNRQNECSFFFFGRRSEAANVGSAHFLFGHARSDSWQPPADFPAPIAGRTPFGRRARAVAPLAAKENVLRDWVLPRLAPGGALPSYREG